MRVVVVLIVFPASSGGRRWVGRCLLHLNDFIHVDPLHRSIRVRVAVCHRRRAGLGQIVCPIVALRCGRWGEREREREWFRRLGQTDGAEMEFASCAVCSRSSFVLPSDTPR